MQRYFAKEKNNNQLILDNNDIYHIKTVMRMKDNDEVIVVFDNVPYLCCLENVNDEITINIKKEYDKPDDNIPFVRLIIPLLKEQKMDLILQKATELGVKEIILYHANRSIIKEKDNFNKKMIRWQKIMKEASEQSHRNDIPSISGVKKIKELEQLDGLKLICSTREKEKSFKNILNLNKTYDKINIVIGPEGGLEEKEEVKLNEIGFMSVSLGSRIMRVETVPLFLLSNINYEYME